MTGPMQPAHSRRVLLIAALAWLAITAWMRPLAVPDEGRYVGVAWEMLRSGDWLVPTLDGLPYFHKPPLFYWITAAALWVSGSALWAARVAPWIGAAMACVSMALFARRWAGDERADATLLALVTAPIFFVGAQYANLDMLVAGCITATILAFAHAALSGPAGTRPARTLLAGYAFCALGVLAKGLIGIVLPGAVLVLWLAWERRWISMVRLLWLPGIALFFLVAAPWFVAMQARFPEFMHYFFVVQHFQRFSQGGFNNAQPFWFYPAVLALAALPWSAWLVLGWRRSRSNDGDLRGLRRLMMAWAAVITLFFTLPQSKLLGYIFPAVPPLMFLAADAAVAWRATSKRLRIAWQSSVAFAIVICVAVAAVAIIKTDRTQSELGRLLGERIRPGDTVYSLDDYRFAIPFEAKLRDPVVVVADWSPAAVASRDNWRRELADAAAFEPAQTWLIGHAQLAARVCRPGAHWIIGNEGSPREYAWLSQAEPVAKSGRTVLWRVGGDVRPAPCRETPSARSGDKS